MTKYQKPKHRNKKIKEEKGAFPENHEDEDYSLFESDPFFAMLFKLNE